MAGGYPLARERNLIVASLIILAALAWLFLARQAGTGMDHDAVPGLTMGMSAPLFLAVWVVMMVAMMFPTAAPMILTFARVHASKREKGQAFVPTWVFVAAYLLVWTAFGALAFVLALGAQALAAGSASVMENAGRIGGVAVLLAGLYQLSPLKHVCLSKCRSPLGFIMTSWRDGYGGAFRMGLEHGVYCLGCCWLLFVLLFPLGMMNIAAMALITLLIFAEKSLAIGLWASRAAAVALVAYGLLVLVMPMLLPTSVPPTEGM